MDSFQKDIHILSRTLTRQQKVAFTYCVCVRLQPHYQYFHDIESWGDPNVIERAIDALRDSVSFELPPGYLKQMHDQVEDVTPDTEDFSGAIASFALNSCSAVISGISFLIGRSDDAVVEVASYARDTIDMYVQELYDLSSSERNIEERIAQDRYMVDEVEWQKALLRTISDSDNLIKNLLNELSKGEMIDINLLSI